MARKSIYEKRRELWVKALRSRKYEQGIDGLNINDEFYCCLGVLCEVAMQNGLSLTKDDDTESEWVEYDGDAEQLPQAVADWVGLESKIGRMHHQTSWDTIRKDLTIKTKYQTLNIAKVDDDGLEILHYMDDKTPGCLATMNDAHIPFDVIADVIEAKPKGLFYESTY